MDWSETGHRRQSWPQVGLQLELVGQVAFAAGGGGRRHAHGFWELLVPRAPFTLLTDDGDRRVAADAVALVPPGLLHTVRAPARQATSLVYLGVAVQGPVAGPAEARVLAKVPAVESLQSAVLQADQALGDGRAVDWFSVLAQIQVLFQHFGLIGSSAVGDGGDLVAGIVAYCQRHRDRPISVAEIARSFYRTPGHVGERFAEVMGQTIKQYHRVLRLDEAARRLRLPGARVATVARELGFSSSQVLSREFRRRFGRTPSEAQGGRQAPT